VDKSQSAVCEIKPIALSQWLQLRAKVSKELQSIASNNGMSPAVRSTLEHRMAGMGFQDKDQSLNRWTMKTLFMPIAALTFLTLCGAFSTASAQINGDRDFRPAVQAIGARTRTEITRVSDRGANVGRALRLQAEGDQALRRGELVLAAEDYGRAREAVSVLDSERSLAVEERSRASLDFERAQRAGDDIAWAAVKLSDGNRAFASGNYVTADIDYAEARADLIGD